VVLDPGAGDAALVEADVVAVRVIDVFEAAHRPLCQGHHLGDLDNLIVNADGGRLEFAIAGATLRVERERRGGDGSLRTQRLDDEGLETDTEGRFVYEALCVEGTRLLVSTGNAPTETPFALAARPDLEHLELAISAPCHLRVFLDDPTLANSLGLLDERDQDLFFTFQIGGVLCSSAGVQIDGGVSDLLLTDERARTLVLRKDNAEVARVPLHLVPGQVNEIRP